jgi:integrase
MAYTWDNMSMSTRNKRFPDTEEVTGSNPVSPTQKHCNPGTLSDHAGSMAHHGETLDGLHNGLHAVRDKGSGSIFQRCEARFGCPPLVDGERPRHDCKGRWYASLEAGFTANGTRRRITVSGKSKAIVKRRLRDKDVELKRDGAANTRRTVTVAKWTAIWLERIEKKIRPASLTTDKAASKWIIKTIGHVKLSELTPEHVYKIAAAIRAAGGSTSTALRYHGSLLRLLKAASVEGYTVPPNVMLADKPTAAINDREAFALPDAIKVLAYLNRRDDNGALVLPHSSRWSLAFLQGIRQGEALGLTWDNVNLETGTLTICWQVQSLKYRETRNVSKGFVVPDGFEARHLAGATHLVRPKSDAGWRVMPLIPEAIAVLEEWKALSPANPHGLVWPGRTTKAGTWPRNKASDLDEWEAIQKALGIRHPEGRLYTGHEIRHTTASLLMALKVPESVRIAIMGHSAIRSTRTYEHVDPAQMLAALSGLGKMLELG